METFKVQRLGKCCRVFITVPSQIHYVLKIYDNIISTVVLISAFTYLTSVRGTEKQYNRHSLAAADLIAALVASFLSIYQIAISLLLLWQTYMARGVIFTSALWYLSHLTALILYGIVFGAKICVYFVMKHYVGAVVTIFLLIVYQGVFIYFTIVVNSYLVLQSLSQDRYL